MSQIMNTNDNPLRNLVRRIFGQDVSREKMEATLVTPIRCALRTGAGMPPLVQWVKQNLPAVVPAASWGWPVDIDWAAPRMARLLCTQMLEHVQAEPVLAGARETVVGV
jgi:hypothetical protein